MGDEFDELLDEALNLRNLVVEPVTSKKTDNRVNDEFLRVQNEPRVQEFSNLIFGSSQEVTSREPSIQFLDQGVPAAPEVPRTGDSLQSPLLETTGSGRFEYEPGSLETYTYEAIQEACQDFAEKLKIGEGGFGKVYKGMMAYKEEWCTVAIKVMSEDGVDKTASFHNEVYLLGSLRHPNIVRLLGFCETRLILVYEYLEHGNLEEALDYNDLPLGWRQRVQITLEVALALEYMHSMKPDPVMHRDLKPANILLDAELHVRLADVGLSVLAPELGGRTGGQSFIQDTSVYGTLGYIDPMYLSSGKFRPASDVYSFGVTLLQIVTGRHDPKGLVDHVDAAVEARAVHEVVDKEAGQWPLSVTMSLVDLAMKCLERRPKDRPSLRDEVIPNLRECLEYK